MGDVEVVEERFTRDDNIGCSAGVSAGIALALAVIAEVSGALAAGRTPFATEHRPSGVTWCDFVSHPKAPRHIRG